MQQSTNCLSLCTSLSQEYYLFHCLQKITLMKVSMLYKGCWVFIFPKWSHHRFVKKGAFGCKMKHSLNSPVIFLWYSRFVRVLSSTCISIHVHICHWPKFCQCIFTISRNYQNFLLILCLHRFFTNWMLHFLCEEWRLHPVFRKLIWSRKVQIFSWLYLANLMYNSAKST